MLYSGCRIVVLRNEDIQPYPYICITSGMGLLLIMIISYRFPVRSPGNSNQQLPEAYVEELYCADEIVRPDYTNLNQDSTIDATSIVVIVGTPAS